MKIIAYVDTKDGMLARLTLALEEVQAVYGIREEGHTAVRFVFRNAISLTVYAKLDDILTQIFPELL